MSDFLTREDLTRPLPRRFKEFDVQVNGSVKRVRIRSLTEKEQAGYEVASLNAKGAWKVELYMHSKCRLVSLCVVGEDNQPLLTPQDAAALWEQDSALTGAIWDECMEHCGQRTKKEEALEKNSDATGADSGASS